MLATAAVEPPAKKVASSKQLKQYKPIIALRGRLRIQIKMVDYEALSGNILIMGTLNFDDDKVWDVTFVSHAMAKGFFTRMFVDFLTDNVPRLPVKAFIPCSGSTSLQNIVDECAIICFSCYLNHLKEVDDNKQEIDRDESSINKICPFCTQPVSLGEQCYLKCLHILHKPCFITFCQKSGSNFVQCPFCPTQIQVRASNPNIPNAIFDYFLPRPVMHEQRDQHTL
jgi:hypothetical protein